MRSLAIVRGREVRLLARPALRDVDSALTSMTPHFLVLLALDARDVPDAEIMRVAEALMDRRAVAFACAGPDCDRVETLVDDVASPRGSGVDGVILTTSHHDGGFSDGLDLVLSIDPAADYLASCGAVLAIVVGNDAWAAEVERVVTAKA